MKPEHLKLIAILLLATPTAVIASEYDMTFVNEKVTPLAAKLSAIPKHLRMVDDTTDILATPEFQALRAKCTTDWQQIAENFEKIQGGNEARKLVIFAFENLTAQNYMTAVEKIVAKYQADLINDDVIRALHLPMGRMRAFLIDNYDHPRVAAALNQIRTKTKNAQLKVSLGETLDGSDKASYDHDRVELAGMPEGDIPKVILPP